MTGQSPTWADETANMEPRFQTELDWRHHWEWDLWRPPEPEVEKERAYHRAMARQVGRRRPNRVAA